MYTTVALSKYTIEVMYKWEYLQMYSVRKDNGLYVRSRLTYDFLCQF